MSKTWSSPIFEKGFFPAENAVNMLEMRVFADFHWTFPYISSKTLMISLICSFEFKEALSAIPLGIRATFQLFGFFGPFPLSSLIYLAGTNFCGFCGFGPKLQWDFL